MNDLNRNTALLRPCDNAYQVTNTLFCIVIGNSKIPVDKVTWATYSYIFKSQPNVANNTTSTHIKFS